jgi:hypothetical protein
MKGAHSDAMHQFSETKYVTARQTIDVLQQNNELLIQNNKLLKEIIEMLRKIAINTS